MSIVVIEEDEFVPVQPSKQKTRDLFNFVTDGCDKYNPLFWDYKEIIYKGKPAIYSRRTKLFLECRKETESDKYPKYRNMRLIGYKDKDTIIPASKCKKEIIDWCHKHRIQTIKDSEL